MEGLVLAQACPTPFVIMPLVVYFASFLALGLAGVVALFVDGLFFPVLPACVRTGVALSAGPTAFVDHTQVSPSAEVRPIFSVPPVPQKDGPHLTSDPPRLDPHFFVQFLYGAAEHSGGSVGSAADASYGTQANKPAMMPFKRI